MSCQSSEILLVHRAQVERWFAILTQRHIRRSSCVSAKDLVAKIEAFIAAYNAKAHPFVWTATSEDLLEKVERIFKSFMGRDTRGGKGYDAIHACARMGHGTCHLS